MAISYISFKSRFIVIVLVFACLALLVGAVAWATYNKSLQESQPPIINKTNTLQVVSAQENLDGQLRVLEITLKNISNRNISAYTLLLGNAESTRDYAFSEELLSPEETSIERIALTKNVGSPNTNINIGPENIIIAAVWFERGNGDGDPKYVTMLRDKHLGYKEGARRILPLLRQALERSKQNSDEALNELESQSSLLPNEDNSLAYSVDYRSGLHLAKEHLGLKIRELKAKRSVVNFMEQQTRLKKLTESYEQLVTKF